MASYNLSVLFCLERQSIDYSWGDSRCMLSPQMRDNLTSSIVSSHSWRRSKHPARLGKSFIHCGRSLKPTPARISVCWLRSSTCSSWSPYCSQAYNFVISNLNNQAVIKWFLPYMHILSTCTNNIHKYIYTHEYKTYIVILCTMHVKMFIAILI